MNFLNDEHGPEMLPTSPFDDLALHDSEDRTHHSHPPSTAEAFLKHLLNFAKTHDEPKVSDAATHISCLLMTSGAYEEAAACLERAAAVPANMEILWPALRQTLINACYCLARESTTSATPANNGAAKPIPQTPPRPAKSTDGAAVPAVPPVLDITNLGTFSVARGGQPLPRCRARKVISLFRYLLTRPGLSASKEELMNLHWPQVKPSAAAHSLHVAISTLRHYLDTPDQSYVRCDNGTYSLTCASSINNDCAVFRGHIRIAERAWYSGDGAVARQAYAAAIATYGGDYYIDDYDMDWALAERERLLADYVTALDRLSQIAMEQREFGDAITCCRRLLERDTYREDIHCRLMHCYLALGRRSEALHQYERCAAVLKAELGLDPMPATTTLFQEIRGGTSDDTGHT